MRHKNPVKPEGLSDRYDHAPTEIKHNLIIFKEWFLITYSYIIFSKCMIYIRILIMQSSQTPLAPQHLKQFSIHILG